MIYSLPRATGPAQGAAGISSSRHRHNKAGDGPADEENGGERWRCV